MPQETRTLISSRYEHFGHKCTTSYLDCFIGTYSRDRLPKIVESLPVGLVVNTDPSDQPGQHWVAIFINKRGRRRVFR